MSHRSSFLLVLVACTGLAGCATTNWEEVANERDRALRDQQAHVDGMNQDMARATAEAESAKAARAAAERDSMAAKKTADEAATRAREWQARAEQEKRDAEARMASIKTAPVAAAPVATMNGSASVEAKAAELRVRYPQTVVTAEGNIEVPLPSDVAFGSGSSALTDMGKKSLKGLSGLLSSEFGPYMIRVEGHTDGEPLKRTTGKYVDNFGLGSARALEVVRFMKSDMKVDAKRLMSASRGEQDPVAANDTAANRAKNRRVEIVVVIPRESATAEAK